MKITINTNSVYCRTWLEQTESGFVGRHHTLEVTRDGRVIRDETGPTGLVAMADIGRCAMEEKAGAS